MLKLAQKQAEDLMADLTTKIDRRWKETVDQTRFMQELKEGKLKMEAIKLFYQNWGAFVPVINSIYTAAFYKHLWFFVKNIDLMEVYTEKLLDEFGHPKPPGHIQILLSTGEALGLSPEEVLLTPMLPEARGLADFHRTLLVDGLIQEYWLSALYEGAFGASCKDWFEALTTHYNITHEQASYFFKHHEADTTDHLGRRAHAEVTQTILIRLLQQGILERPGYSLEYCALTPVNLNASMMDAVYKATR
ncbi:MAG: iron-containing redox enzyme family protein [Deltaproteobacteria bacterium]|nr:iron-containing redox enzyme family protein [Deltaproteobacteria bacterium]